VGGGAASPRPHHGRTFCGEQEFSRRRRGGAAGTTRVPWATPVHVRGSLCAAREWATPVCERANAAAAVCVWLDRRVFTGARAGAAFRCPQVHARSEPHSYITHPRVYIMLGETADMDGRGMLCVGWVASRPLLKSERGKNQAPQGTRLPTGGAGFLICRHCC
jgi:hypothetical protein